MCVSEADCTQEIESGKGCKGEKKCCISKYNFKIFKIVLTLLRLFLKRNKLASLSWEYIKLITFEVLYDNYVGYYKNTQPHNWLLYKPKYIFAETCTADLTKCEANPEECKPHQICIKDDVKYCCGK